MNILFKICINCAFGVIPVCPLFEIRVKRKEGGKWNCWHSMTH